MTIYPTYHNQRTIAMDLFNINRREAQLQRLVERIVHHDKPLAEFRNLTGIRENARTYLGIKDVPLKQITGSVSRAGDFDRHLRPLHRHLLQRWVNLYMMLQTTMWPPVTLYKVGEDYYVEDGHHRVSVARAVGIHYILARVWEYPLTLKPTRRRSAVAASSARRQRSLPCPCDESVAVSI